jgi:hypothetical protein
MPAGAWSRDSRKGLPKGYPNPFERVWQTRSRNGSLSRSRNSLHHPRRKKAGQVLALFPDAGFWHQVMAEYQVSTFLQGRRPSAGHEWFRADFDWLISRGKDGLENCLKVCEGKYRDTGGDGPTSHEPRAAHSLEVMQTFFTGGSRDALPGS